jgi:hypothetical protein
LKRLNQIIDLLLSFSCSLREVLIPARKRVCRYDTHFQEDIQLLPDTVDPRDLCLGFLDEVVLLLLELFSPFFESRYASVRMELEYLGDARELPLSFGQFEV